MFGTGQTISTHSTFDNNGNILTQTDGNGHTTTNIYDAANRLEKTTTLATVTNHYDALGNLTQVVDGGNRSTSFTYDGLGRKLTTTWGSGTETLIYDALLQTGRNAASGHTSYAYDHRDRLTDIGHGTHPLDNQQRTYDALGRVLTVTYPNEPSSLRDVANTYDVLGRILTETSGGVLHTYADYDKAGNRHKTTYGITGRHLVSTYDALNRLETLTEKDSALDLTGRVTTYHYDLAGNVTRKVLPNGNHTDTHRDILGRTLRIEEQTSGDVPVTASDYSTPDPETDWTTGYDAAGNVLKVVETYSRSGMAGRVVVNTYDDANRLLSETITTGGGTPVVTTYGYDGSNNRTTKVVGSDSTTYVFGASNELLSYGPTGVQPPAVNFTYDANGNRKTRTEGPRIDTYTWDPDNRLITLAYSTGTEYRYAYDYRSRRVVRDESGAGGIKTALSFSGGTSVQEYQIGESSNLPNTETIRGSDWGGGVGGILYTITPATNGPVRSYNAYNSRGDVVSTTGDAGTATWQASYEAFGTRTAADGINAARQRANTKEEDPTGLLNEGMRYRDLAAGVFISRDPAGFVDGPNVYTYVNQNPWSAYDSEGLFLGFVVDAGFAIWDTAQYASGNISGGEYATRMALTGASVIANAASAGTAGLAVRGASIASRAARATNTVVKVAKAVDKANDLYETGSAIVENAGAMAEAVAEGDSRGMAKALTSTALEMVGGKKADGALGAISESQRKTKQKTSASSDKYLAYKLL